MRVPFSANLLDEETGFQFIVDIEVEVEADIEWEDGEPVLDIGRVFAICQEPMEARQARATETCPYPSAATISFDMLERGGIWKHLALEIIEQAEDDDEFFLAVLTAHDVVFSGHVADPDAAGWRVMQ
jgi:hypothetical protein